MKAPKISKKVVEKTFKNSVVKVEDPPEGCDPIETIPRSKKKIDDGQGGRFDFVISPKEFFKKGKF